MTPDKDGWCYWVPGDERPNADDICDVERRVWIGSWVCEDAPPAKWVTETRRYRLKENPMSPKVGDEVILKTMKVIHVGGTQAFAETNSGASYAAPFSDIAQIIPAKREFKPGDRVKADGPSCANFRAKIVAVDNGLAWVTSDVPGFDPIWPLSDLQHMEDEQ